MELCALASGSSGNCFFISDNNKNILIDAGISAKQITERLAIINKGAEDIDAIFITHEHTDHIRGADVFARKFKVPIYLTKNTEKNSFICSDKDLINTIKNDETIKIGKLNVEAFQKSHLVSDPVSFSVSSNKSSNKNSRVIASIITDLGYVCDNTRDHIRDSNFIFLESNHDEEMLKQGFYPWYLKKWILSDQGHLSNNQASLAVLEHGNKKLKNLVLSHISKNNNTPELALKAFEILRERKDLNPKISLSCREFPTQLFKI